MSGHSGSTSTNNVSQDPTTIFAAPHPPARKDATVDGASVPSAQKVYTLDEEDMDDSDRAWLAQMRKKHEASKEFTAKQDQLLNRKKTLQATKVAANRKFETDTAQLVSTPNFECIHTLPAEKMGSVVHTCTDIVTKAMDTLKEQTKSLLEGTEIVHNDLSAEEVRKLGLLTLQLTVQRELAVFSSDVEIKKIDDELHDLRTAHDRKMAEFRNAPQAGPNPILSRLSTEARAEQKAKEMVDANMRKTWTFLKEQGTSEAMLRTAFPQFYTDAPVVDRDDEAKKQQEAAAKAAEEERLAQQAAEEERLAQQAAAKAAEDERLAQQAAAKAAEDERLAQQAAAKAAEDQRLAQQAAAKAAEEKRLAQQAAAQAGKKQGNATQTHGQKKRKICENQSDASEVSSEASTPPGGDDEIISAPKDPVSDARSSDAGQAKKPRTEKSNIETGKNLIKDWLETGKSDETIYELLESSFKSSPADVEILKKQVSFLRNAHVRKQAEKNAALGSAHPGARTPAAGSAHPGARTPVAGSAHPGARTPVAGSAHPGARTPVAGSAPSAARTAAAGSAPSAASAPAAGSAPSAARTAAAGSAPSAARTAAAGKQPLPYVLAPRQAAAALPDVPRKPTDRQGEQAPRPVAGGEPVGDIVHKDANGELISNPRILNVIKYVLDPDNIVKVMDSDFIDEDDEIEIPKIWQERVREMRKALRAFFLENFTEKQLDSVKKSRTATNLRLQMYNVFYKVYGLPTQWKTFKVLIEEGKINKKDETTENWLPFSDFDKFFEGFRWTDGHKNALKVSLRIPLKNFKEEIAKRAPDGAGPS
jgi:hypothetical protein